MSDSSVDITMENVVEQYRDELAKETHEKLLLQAAVKKISDWNIQLHQQIDQLNQQIGQLNQQIGQLTVDLQTAMAVSAPFDQDAVDAEPGSTISP